MKILYLAHRIPYPPDKGDKLRAFHQIEHLARSHRVWCVCLVDDPADMRHVDELSWHCEEVIAVPLNRRWAMIRGVVGLACGSTVTRGYHGVPAFRRAIDSLRRRIEFDAVVAFSSSMAPHALRVPASRRVLDLCDLDSQKWLAYAADSKALQRVFYRTEGRRLARMERRWVDAFDVTTVITQEEAREIKDHVPSGKLHVVGNGVDLPERNRDHDPAANGNGSPRSGPVVGFIGQMDYRPNVDAVCWFVRRCWPMIRTQCPGARFCIVGRSPAPAVRKLGSRSGVEVVGAVADATEAVRGFDVSVAPLRLARGLQNKVLEAMAAARAVVLTSAAGEGIAARHERECLVADDPDDFADAVLDLLYNPQRRARLGRAARAFVARHHRWERELTKFELLVTGATPAAVGRRESLPTSRAPREKVRV